MPVTGDSNEGLETAATKADPAFLPAVEYFEAGKNFSIGILGLRRSRCRTMRPIRVGLCSGRGIRMALATDLGYMPQNVKEALRGIDVLLLESNHDLEMLRDGPYPCR